MALLILALLQRIFLMSSLMLLLVWLIFFMVLIKLLPILGTISGKTVKLMVLALICLGNNLFFQSRSRHTSCSRDWSSDVCSPDLADDEVSARFARDLHRHRAHEPAVDVLAPPYRGRLENHRHAARGPHRHAGVAAREGDEPAGGELGGDRDEGNVELLDHAPLQGLVDVGLKPIAFDEAAVRKYEVDQLVALHREGRLEQLFISYAVFCLKKKKAAADSAGRESSPASSTS